MSMFDRTVDQKQKQPEPAYWQMRTAQQLLPASTKGLDLCYSLTHLLLEAAFIQFGAVSRLAPGGCAWAWPMLHRLLQGQWHLKVRGTERTCMPSCRHSFSRPCGTLLGSKDGWLARTSKCCTRRLPILVCVVPCRGT